MHKQTFSVILLRFLWM